MSTPEDDAAVVKKAAEDTAAASEPAVTNGAAADAGKDETPDKTAEQNQTTTADQDKEQPAAPVEEAVTAEEEKTAAEEPAAADALAEPAAAPTEEAAAETAPAKAAAETAPPGAAAGTAPSEAAAETSTAEAAAETSTTEAATEPAAVTEPEEEMDVDPKEADVPKETEAAKEDGAAAKEAEAPAEAAAADEAATTDAPAEPEKASADEAPSKTVSEEAVSTAEASNDGDKPALGGDEAMETAAEKEPAKEAPVEAPTPPPPKLPTEAPPPAVKPVKPARSGFDILNIVEEVAAEEAGEHSDSDHHDDDHDDDMDIGVGGGRSSSSLDKDKQTEEEGEKKGDDAGAMDVDKDGDSVIKISAVSGSNDDCIQIADDDDEDGGGTGLQIKSVEGSSLKISAVSGATTSTANGSAQTADVVELDDDDSSSQDSKKDGDSSKKKPVLKLASFAGMSVDKSKASDPNANVQNPSKHNKVTGCAQCFKIGATFQEVLVWETMRFCNEICLGEYQNTMANCSTCKKTVQDSLLGKYCVRFGADIKQFCSNVCLDEHKKGLKVCCYCQKDISGGDGFLAPIGDKGQFKDFCVQECLQKYEELNCGKKIDKPVEPCAVCGSEKPVDVKLILFPKDGDQKVVSLCSTVCFSAYKFTSNYDTDDCDQCTTKFQKLDDEKVKHVIHYGGKTKKFCAAACQNVFVMQNRDIVPCKWCNVRKYNFDMIEKAQGPKFIHFCSLNCFNQHGSSGQAGATAVSTASGPSGGGMPVIQSVSSLAPTSGASPVIPPPSLPATPLPPPPPQIIHNTVTKTVTDTVVKPADVPDMRNKAVMTKPYMMTKGVSCRPHPCHKGTQTDGPSIPAMVPIVVPMYMPMPMAMYAKPYPVPVPVPIPVPVPVFIPTSRNTARGVEKAIEKIRSKVPADPFEAEMLAMAGALVTEKDDDYDSPDSVAGDGDLWGGDDDDEGGAKKRKPSMPAIQFTEDMESEMKAGKVVPKHLPQLSADAVPVNPPPPQINHAQRNNYNQGHKRGRDDSDEENADEPGYRQQQRRRTPQKRQRRSNAGNRNRSDCGTNAAVAAITNQQPKERPDAKHHLKFTYGVNAWKHWVVGKNAELEKARAQGKYLKNFETDILKLRADELSYTLCMFVKEVKKPNGDSYAADSVLYLAYGIQEYLFENGRIDNMFTDMYYEPFTSALHEVVKDFKLPMNELGYYVTRIEEEHLWEAKQLGAHSPQVLLNTLVYFNTKYFMLRTAEDHQRLSFTHVMKHWKKNSVRADGQKAIILRYYPPAKRGQRQDERKAYEQQECTDNPLRCPVKLYEFYLSKCPENSKTRNDLFYLMPERSCLPDSPVWFSNTALPHFSIDKMLCRSLMVREVQEHVLADAQS